MDKGAALAEQKKDQQTEEKVAKPSTIEVGGFGNTIYSGLVLDDYNPKLQGSLAIKTYDKMRRSDAMVKAVLLCVELPLRAGEWYIEGSEDVPEEITDFVHEALFERMSISFDDWMHHVLLMMPFGFSIFEKVFKLEDGKIYWRKLAPRLPQSLYKWRYDENGSLTGIQQYALKNDQYKYIDLDLKNLLVFTYDREGGNYEGISMLRPAYKHWYIKDVFYKVAGIGIERQAVGVPVIELPEGATDPDKTAAEKIVQKIRANERAGLSLPAGWKFRFEEGKVKATEILDHIKHHDTMIARTALAQFMQTGSEGTGSYALSKDQSDFFMLALEGVARIIADTINRHAIKQLVDYNFKTKAYPKLCYSIGRVDKKALVEGVKQLTDGGIVLPDANLETFMRDKLGLPEKDEASVYPARPTKEVIYVEGGKHDARRLSEPYKGRRALTKWEQGVNFKEIDDRFTEAEQKLIAELTVIGDKQIEDLVKQVERTIETGQLKDLYKLTVRYRGEYAQTLRGIMQDLAQFGVNQAKKETGVASEELTRYLKNWLTVKADSLVELHAARIKSTVMISTLNSLDAGLSTKAVLYNATKDLKAYLDRDLNGMAHVIVGEAVNRGRNEIVRSGEFQAAQFSAILDRKTCPLCSQLDGMVIDIKNPDFDRFTPPVHANCRCIWVYINKSEQNVEIDWKTPSQDMTDAHGHLIA